MSGYAAQLAIMASCPSTLGHSFSTANPPPKPSAITASFETYTIRLAKQNAWCFFRLLLSIYACNKVARGPCLRNYSSKEGGYLFGILSHNLESICAAEANFYSPAALDAYLDRIAAARQALWKFPRNCDLEYIRRFFFDIFEYQELPSGMGAGMCKSDEDTPMIDILDVVKGAEGRRAGMRKAKHVRAAMRMIQERRMSERQRRCVAGCA